MEEENLMDVLNSRFDNLSLLADELCNQIKQVRSEFDFTNNDDSLDDFTKLSRMTELIHTYEQLIYILKFIANRERTINGEMKTEAMVNFIKKLKEGH